MIPKRLSGSGDYDEQRGTARYDRRQQLIDTTAAIVGFPEARRDLANAAAVCAEGRVLGVYRKHQLPNYAVFDEQRYFSPSTVDGPLFVIAGVRVALSVCEDAWSPSGPIITQAAGGAELVVNINASPTNSDIDFYIVLLLATAMSGALGGLWLGVRGKLPGTRFKI